MEFTNTLQNLCLNIIVDTVQDNRGFVEFHEALLSVKLPSLSMMLLFQEILPKLKILSLRIIMKMVMYMS